MIRAMTGGRAALALLGVLAAGQAAAETRTVPGQTLALTLTHSADTVISTDPGLAGAVRVTADGPLECLSVVEGRTAVIGTAACAGDDLGTLRIAVAPHMPVVLTASGEGSIKIDGLHASLTVSLSGGSDLQAGDVGSFALLLRGGGDVSVGTVDGSASVQISGSGDVKIGTLNGPLSLRRTGSGNLSVGTINAPGVAIDSTGSGETKIGGGRIAGLQVDLRGSGDLSVAATVASGQVTASGGGDVTLATVTGPLTRRASGGSDITVGGSSASEPDEAGENHRTVIMHRDHTAGHVVAAALVAVLLFFIWRIVRRNRSLPGLRGRSGPKQPDSPVHPGVLAVGDTMARLEQRLGRIEGYVTTREFDLNRKFRDLK